MIDTPQSVQPSIAESGPEPAAWSASARWRLIAASAMGTVAALFGWLLAGEPLDVVSDLGVLQPAAGVTLLFVGVIVMVQSISLLLQSGPDRVYAPGNATRAGAFFVVVWLVGTILGTGFRLQTIGDLKGILLLCAVAGVTLAGAGALWVFRRFGAQVDRRWPSTAESIALRRRPMEWSVFFAFVWGVLSVIPALWLELRFVELLGPLFESRAAAITRPEDVLLLLRDPVIVLGLALLVVVAAPLIEEASKAIGLWLFRGAIRSHGDGLALGFAAGLGFGLIESALYIWAILVLSGSSGAGLFTFAFVWLRVVAIWLHGVVTGLIGAEYARARLTGNRRVIGSGLLRAATAHGAWNAYLILFILTIDLGLFALVLIGVYIALVATRLVKVLTAAIDRSIQNDHALNSAPLPETWWPMEEGLWWRLAGGRPEYPPPPGSA